MAMTEKNMINSKVKEICKVRAELKRLKALDESLKNEIVNYLVKHGQERFDTANGAIKLRHVQELKFDKNLGLTESDLVKVALKCGWLDSLKVNKAMYHEHSKEVNDGESVYIESERLDIMLTYRKN